MFVHALDVANGFVFPYVGLTHHADGSVRSTLAAFMVVNSDGWVLTAGHVVDEILRVRDDVERARAGVPRPDGSAVLHHGEIWALPGFEGAQPALVQATVDTLRDLALVRLEPFDASWAEGQPRFRSPDDEILPGLAVCRLGFPFYDIAVDFDARRGEFALAPHAFPVPRFALDGIVSRFRNQVADDGRIATFIETSTPGLRGQSGGPLLDAEGRVCGVQSHTVHLDLGFDASYEREGRLVVERQFLNVGAATHVRDVLAFLEENGVEHSIA